MKKLLLASAALLATTGLAAAEVTLSGDARMGIEDDGDANGTFFSSRARVAFTMSGETDGGLSFGASLRADNSVDASAGDGGSVFISGAFGKLTMGDVDGAAQMATGHVAGVGFTGAGDLNESTFLAAGGGAGTATDGADPTALYEYSTGAFTGYVSITNPAAAVEEYALGAKYTTDTFTVGLGYESIPDLDTTHVVAKGSATFNGVTVQALYGQADMAGVDGSQAAISVGYAMDAVGVTAFYSDDSELGGAEAYGIGASYGLGGGATIAGGVAKNKTADVTMFDLGVTFSF